jgi:SPP1 gp7 family putative phage head morphogenesis protein
MSRFDFIRRMFAVTKPTAQDTSIVSVETSTYGAGAGIGTLRMNPDDLVRRKGLLIYAKMRNDEQVKAVCTFKRDAVLSRGWSLEYDEDSPLSEEERQKRVGILRKIIDRMPGSFIDALNAISTGREFGFSLTEKVFQTVEIDGTAWTGLRKLVARDPTTFEFQTDPYGELVKCTQTAAGQMIDIDLDKFIFYVHNPEFDPYFGQSDLRAAYRSWYIKDQTLNFWAGFLERFGSGFLIGTLSGDNAPKFGTPAYNALQRAMSNARNGASMIAPQGVEVDVKYPATTDAYENACTWHDLAIARALLVPNLLGVSHTGTTGAFAQSQTQLEAFAWTVTADKLRLEACLTDQLIRDLGDRNWGDGEYPRFAFNPVSMEHVRWLIATWGTLAQQGVVLATEEDEQRLRHMLDMPARNDDSKLLKEAAPPAPAPGAAAAPPEEGEEGEEEGEEGEEEGEEETPPTGAREGRTAREGRQAREAMTRKGRSGFVCEDRRAFERAVERVNFAVVEKRQNTLAENLVTDMASVVARSVSRLMGDDANLRKLTDVDVEDIAGVELSGVEKGKLKNLSQRALNSSWFVGQQMSQDELRRLGVEHRPRRARMADIRDNAAAYFEANGFRMAGNVSDGTRAIIQQELQNSVKYGRTPSETRQAIWSRLVAKGFTTRESVRTSESDEGVLAALDELWVDTEDAAASYLDTLARTNLYEAMNESRYASFTDPELDGFVVALRYSAVLDQRTTEICSALHDRVFKADSEVWNEYRPPNHYNCRSLLIPITQTDIEAGDWDGTESELPDVEPQAGFGKEA